MVCWGNNTSGELGEGTVTELFGPVAVSGLTDAVEISARAAHTCARRASGSVVCWGNNTSGELGDATMIERHTPVAVAGLTDAVEISVGGEVVFTVGHTCARRASGAVVCWGANSHGELGNGTVLDGPTPVPVSGLTDAIEISARGEQYACARRASGAVVCWGDNLLGELGDGASTDEARPVAVSGLLDAIELSAGGRHACARRTSGAVVCWGENASGELGDGTVTNSLLPVTVLPPP